MHRSWNRNYAICGFSQFEWYRGDKLDHAGKKRRSAQCNVLCFLLVLGIENIYVPINEFARISAWESVCDETYFNVGKLQTNWPRLQESFIQWTNTLQIAAAAAIANIVADDDVTSDISAKRQEKLKMKKTHTHIEHTALQRCPQTKRYWNE